MGEANGHGSIETTPAELSRIVQLLSGKGGAGKLPFPAIGLDVSAIPDGSVMVAADHRGKMDTASLRASWFGAKAEPGTHFQVATDDPDRLLDYMGAGLFTPDAGLRVTYDGDAKRIVLTDGSRRASMATVSFAEIPRPDKPDVYGLAPGGLWVSTDPKKRPTVEDGGAMKWESWLAKGYTIAKIPMASIAQLLSAGGLLFSHNYRGVLFRLDVHQDGIEATIRDPKNPDADAIRFERIPGVTVMPGVTEETFSILYAAVEPLWSSLRTVKAESAILVHHPLEKRINLLIAEDTEAGVPVLRMTEAFMSWRDPRSAKSE